MNSMIYYKFYYKDHIANTAYLSAEEVGVYNLLMMAYLNSGEPLPSDERLLAKLCRMTPKKFKKFQFLLKNFFVKDGLVFRNLEIDKQISEYARKSAATRAAAETRWKKENERKDADALQTSCKSNAILELELELKANNSYSVDKTDLVVNSYSEEILNSEEKEKNKQKKKKPSPGAELPAAACSQARLSVDNPNSKVIDLFEYWKKKTNHPRATLDDKRRRKIAWALKHYSFEDLQKAIDGNLASDFHQGKLPNSSKVFDDIELICRDAQHVENFIKIYEKSQKPAQETIVLPDWIATMHERLPKPGAWRVTDEMLQGMG